MSLGKVAVLFTGGKDSTYAIQKLRSLGYEVSCLVSMISENPFSYMLHTPNICIAELSATALEIPIFFGHTLGEEGKELQEISDSIAEARKRYGFNFLASGGLSSNYQKSRIEKIGNQLGVESLAPLWGIEQSQYIQILVDKGYHYILTSISAAGLNEKWLGREIDEGAVDELLNLSRKYQFNPAFEGGEAETLVLDCPLFLKKRLDIIESDRKWDGVRGTLLIKKAILVDKS